MTFQKAKELLGYQTTTGVKIFSRLKLAFVLKVTRETIEKWEDENFIPDIHDDKIIEMSTWRSEEKDTDM